MSAQLILMVVNRSVLTYQALISVSVVKAFNCIETENLAKVKSSIISSCYIILGIATYMYSSFVLLLTLPPLPISIAPLGINFTEYALVYQFH